MPSNLRLWFVLHTTELVLAQNACARNCATSNATRDLKGAPLVRASRLGIDALTRQYVILAPYTEADIVTGQLAPASQFLTCTKPYCPYKPTRTFGVIM